MTHDFWFGVASCIAMEAVIAFLLLVIGYILVALEDRRNERIDRDGENVVDFRSFRS